MPKDSQRWQSARRTGTSTCAIFVGPDSGLDFLRRVTIVHHFSRKPCQPGRADASVHLSTSAPLFQGHQHQPVLIWVSRYFVKGKSWKTRDMSNAMIDDHVKNHVMRIITYGTSNIV